MQLYDPKNILSNIDAVCDAIANDFENQIRKGLDNGFPPFISRMILDDDYFPSLDDWWAILDGNQSLFEKHTEAMKELSPEDLKEKREIGLAELERIDGLRENTQKSLRILFNNNADNPDIDILNRYLPHEAEYAYPSLIKLPGFKRLNLMLSDIDLKLVIEPNPNATDLNDKDSYLLTLNFLSQDSETSLIDILHINSRRFPKGPSNLN